MDRSPIGRLPGRATRVLVTGADGQIGRAVTAALLAVGHPVTGLALHWSSGDRPDSPEELRVTGDATDPAIVAEALEDVGAVVHTAALAHPDKADPYTVFRTNTAATFNVLAQSAARGVSRAVLTSSINAIGLPFNHHEIDPGYYPLDEEMPAALDDAYSLSKHTDEYTATMVHSRWGMDVVALRLPYTTGRSRATELSRALTADPASVPHLYREGWSYLLLDDAVDAVLAALSVPLSGAHTVLVAADDILPDLPTFDLLNRFAPGVPCHIGFPGRAGLVDTGRARQLLGWAPSRSVHRPTPAEASA